MQPIFSLATLFLVIAIVANTLLAIVVYRSNTKSVTNILFSVLSLIISLWLITLYIAQNPAFILTDLFWIRASITIAAPMSMLFFLLAHTLPSTNFLLPKRLITFIFFVTTIVIIINASPYAFTGIEENTSKPIPGPGIALFGVLSTFFSVTAVYILLRKLKKSKGLVRQQLRAVMIGILLMLGLIISTIFLPVVLFQNDFFVPLSPLYAFAFLGTTAYAIIQHRLFNVKIIFTQTFVIILGIILFAKIFIAPSLLMRLYEALILMVTVYFGILLIRSVRKEVEQKEELQTLTYKLERANVELKKLDAAKSEFISIASHQLRTPLTATKGYLSLALEGTYGKLSEKVREPIAKVYESNERLIRLVNDLLSLSRIESGKMKLEPVDTNIEEMIASIVDELKVKAAQKNLELIFQEPKPALPILRVDSEKVRNAVLNIIDNSIRYTNIGSITVRTAQLENAIRITITDTGEGMTKEEIAKLFQSFSRGQAGAKLSTEGAGLGLYIAKQFVQMHNGRIWAESPGEGRGSVFHIELPVR